MKCPACNNQLTTVRVGEHEVDVCRGGCGGVWFDAFELQKVDERHETEGNVLSHIERDPKVVVDPTRKRECPRCRGIKFKRHFFSPKCRVEVDHCPNCAGYWLDAGELEQIKALRPASAPAPVAEPKPGNMSADFIRYLYRLQQEIDDKPSRP